MRVTRSDLDIFRSFRLDPSEFCPCGLALNPRGKCGRCDNPNAAFYASLPADDPRRFSFDLSREDNPHPFGFGNADAGANDRISRRPRGGGR